MAHQPAQQQYYHQQGETAYQAGYRRPSPVLYIRGGAGDSAGGREAAEERGDYIGRPLGHQLHVGIVAPAYHPVGHYRRQQGFDGSKHRYGESRPEEAADDMEIYGGQGR